MNRKSPLSWGLSDAKKGGSEETLAEEVGADVGGGGGNMRADRGQTVKENVKKKKKSNSFPLFTTFVRLVEREWISLRTFFR